MAQKIENVAEYYVYVYIDPRNNEEFYYGKGKGSRKEAHLYEKDTTLSKAKRIHEIKEAGFAPIIRIIAKNLTEEQAFLVEKTLIWKFEKTLLNKATGHFGEEFRPQDTLHLELAGFDFQNGLYYVNFSEGTNGRNWEDCRNYGFIVAGGGEIYSKPLKKLNIGDIIAVYMGGLEYLGIGRVQEKSINVSEFLYNGLSLREVINMKEPNIFNDFDNENAQWLVKVEWIKTISEQEAEIMKNKRKNIEKIRIYAHPKIVTVLDDPTTLNFLEKEFEVNFKELLAD